MHEVIGTITTATSTELKITCRCPREWVDYPKRSSQIIRKLLPDEIWTEPNGDYLEQELLGNRNFQPTLELGNKVIIHLFLN
jgi:hypothetical protein